MKLPNGYGSVTKLSGARRNPWMARLTTDFTDEGVQIRTILGYFPTRTAALQALAEYHHSPFDLKQSKVTVEEIYKRWYNENIDDNTNQSTLRQTEAAYNRLEPLHKTPMRDLKVAQMQELINQYKSSYHAQCKVKQLLNKLFEVCIDHDVISSNPTNRLRITAETNKTESTRTAFTQEEIDLIWKNKEDIKARYALMLIYSGVRVGELVDLKVQDVNLEERYFKVKKSKTESGIRVVPIAEKVYPLWVKCIEESKCGYVMHNAYGDRMVYNTYHRTYWQPLMKHLGFKHVVHETRHTCITLLTLANVNPTIIKNIVGHKSAMSLTEKVYTHIDIKPLIEAINKI